jgi:hypothetical protein
MLAALIQDDFAIDYSHSDDSIAFIVGPKGALPHDLGELKLECLRNREHAHSRLEEHHQEVLRFFFLDSVANRGPFSSLFHRALPLRNLCWRSELNNIVLKRSLRIRSTFVVIDGATGTITMHKLRACTKLVVRSHHLYDEKCHSSITPGDGSVQPHTQGCTYLSLKPNCAFI